ncbi:hypothetical protein [Mesorhizobium sp. M0118]|uniref:hypothetical protein n=1 Tax=Mesorhizobium sp. M0118 TaxID=2956884 RepID=UPI00333AAC89
MAMAAARRPPTARHHSNRIGGDVSEGLDIVVRGVDMRLVRAKALSCRLPMPARLIEGGLQTEATVAQALLSG